METKPLPDCTGLTSQSPFQLQTSSIRNSAPFKSKSADIFSSLEVMERKYESSINSVSLDEDEDEGGDTEERLSIERGCIFQKPLGLLGGSGSGDRSTLTKSNNMLQATGKACLGQYDTLSGKGYDRRIQPQQALTSPSSSPSSSTEKDAQSSDDKTVFRKPDGHNKSKMLRGEISRYKHPSWSRGRGQADLTVESRGRVPPDHLLNPQKYTKYSLEETNMCGNAANRSVALGFLNDLRKRKESELNADRDVGVEGKHIFHKPTLSENSNDGPEPSLRRKAYGSVYNMPEYEVGRGSTEPKLKKPNVMDSQKVLQQTKDAHHASVFDLDHLQDEESTEVQEMSFIQSEVSSTAGGAGSEQPELVKETSFKSRKGKQKRQIRGRLDEEEA